MHLYGQNPTIAAADHQSISMIGRAAFFAGLQLISFQPDDGCNVGGGWHL